MGVALHTCKQCLPPVAEYPALEATTAAEPEQLIRKYPERGASW